MNEKSACEPMFPSDQKVVVDGGFLNRTYEAIARLQLAYENIDKRLAALEAQPAPAPEYAPGRIHEENDFAEWWVDGLSLGNNARLIVDHEKRIELRIEVDGEVKGPLQLNKRGLQELIGTGLKALEVLKRMEMGGE